MKKLLFTEIKRTLLSPLFWLCIIIVIAINANEILFCSYGSQTFVTTFLFEHTSILGVILSVFIPLQVGQEFEYRTINNKISIGYTHSQIYFAELLVSGFCAFMLLLLDSLFGIFFCILQHYKWSNHVHIATISIHFVIITFTLCTVAALCTAIVMTVHQRIFSIVIVTLLAISLLNAGDKAVFFLQQEPYLIVTEENSVTEKRQKNDIYLSGNERTFTNFHIFLSPYAQLEYEPYILYETKQEKQENSFLLKNVPYHLEYSFTNVLEILCFTAIGLSIFKKQNLK